MQRRRSVDIIKMEQSVMGLGGGGVSALNV
jgi:hypothetical protein